MLGLIEASALYFERDSQPHGVFDQQKQHRAVQQRPAQDGQSAHQLHAELLARAEGVMALGAAVVAYKGSIVVVSEYSNS